MASITLTQIQKLIRIGRLVDDICGPNGQLVRCSCLDHDDEVPHEPGCAWAIVSPAMELLWIQVDSTPEGIRECREDFTDIIDASRVILEGEPKELLEIELTPYSAALLLGTEAIRAKAEEAAGAEEALRARGARDIPNSLGEKILLLLEIAEGAMQSLATEAGVGESVGVIRARWARAARTIELLTNKDNTKGEPMNGLGNEG